MTAKKFLKKSCRIRDVKRVSNYMGFTLSQRSTADESVQLLQDLRDGDDSAFAKLFSIHRPRLEKIVRFRMDRRLYGRVDPDDVLQESFVDGQNRLENLRNSPTHSFLVWIRLIVGQTLINVHRRHLKSERRDASRDVAIHSKKPDPNTSDSMVIQLADSLTSPSAAFSKKEIYEKVTQAVDSLAESDREIVAMRHFEELSNNEIAEILNITPKNASIRYIRALERLRSHLAKFTDLFNDTVN